MKPYYLILALAAQPLFAETVVQPKDFAVDNSASLYNGTGSTALVNPGFFSATCQPFNASLGTLKNFTVDCNIFGSLAGTVGSQGDNGNASGSLGGTFFVNSVGFGGTGSGNGGAGGTGDPLDVTFAIPTFHYVFDVANSGVSYDPRILAAVTGSTPFPVDFNSSVNVTYANVVDLAASVEGTLSLTYEYETASGTETLKIVSVVHNGTQHTVSIEWTSASGKTYAIDASTDLSSNSWSPIQTGVAASAGATTSFVEQNIPATVSRRFYRVREEN